MIFPLDNWRQRAVDKEGRHQSGRSSMRVSHATLALLDRVRGNIEASDDETVFYLAQYALGNSNGASVAPKPTRSRISDSERIPHTPTRPVNAFDAERGTLPSERRE